MMKTFDAGRTLQIIGRYRITHAQFVPTMFVRMLKLPGELRAGFKAPRSVQFVNDLSRTETGKLVKADLKKYVSTV
jgi:acyl-coenzyme A synthetase/AMP-(fatty) acid ligase